MSLIEAEDTQMLIRNNRFRALTVGLFGALALATSSRAATIDTYDFSQSGYTAGGAVFNPLVGSFSGQVEPTGLIELSDLTSFLVRSPTITNIPPGGPPMTEIVVPAFFSFNTTGGNSTLDVAASTADGEIKVCAGAAAAFGGTIAGVNCGAGGGSTGYIYFAGGAFATNQFAQVTLVSSVTAPAAAPEPGTLPLFTLASALILIGAARSRWISR